MTRTAVVLVDLPPVLRDVIRETLDVPDVEVAGELPLQDASVEEIAKLEPDVVIVATDDVVPPGVTELMAASPAIRVLLLRDSGRRGSLLELRMHETSLGEISAEAVLEIVRMNAQG